MLTAVNPKLPMRDKALTRDFYISKLGFREFGREDYPGYLMVEKDQVQLHFFEFKDVDPAENYGQVYIRTDDIGYWYALAKEKQLQINSLEPKPWGQAEFSIHDPDNNLLTFGQPL